MKPGDAVLHDGAPSELAPEAREFIDAYIPYLEALDALLVLHDDPSRLWSIDDVATGIGADVETTRRALTELHAHGLVWEARAAAVFRYAGPTGADARTMTTALASVARASREARPAVVDYVAGRALKRLRMLAEAFTRGPR